MENAPVSEHTAHQLTFTKMANSNLSRVGTNTQDTGVTTNQTERVDFHMFAFAETDKVPSNTRASGATVCLYVVVHK